MATLTNSVQTMYNINSHDEWGQLKEVIVGVVRCCIRLRLGW